MSSDLFVAWVSLPLVSVSACSDRSSTSSEDGSGSEPTTSDDGLFGDDGSTGADGGDGGGTSTDGGDGGTTTGGTTTGSTESWSSGLLCEGAMACGPAEYCDFDANSCGTNASDFSHCADRPEICDPEEHLLVCACDGTVYESPCMAAAAGFDIADTGGCASPDGLFPCGHLYCEVATEYCEQILRDAAPNPDIFACHPLPPECVGTPTCDCLGEGCAGQSDCTELPGGGVVVDCPDT